MAELHVADTERRPFFTIRGLAQFLSLNERSIRRLLNSGEIPSYYFGTARRIDPDDVDAYIARRRDDRRAA